MRIFLAILFAVLFVKFQSQNLIKVDEYGVITDSILIKELQKEYKIIGTFQQADKNSEIKYARVLKEVKYGSPYWGCINLSKEEFIPPKYFSITPFENGHAIVRDKIEKDKEYNCGRKDPCISKEEKSYYYFIDIHNKRISDYFDKIKKDETGKYYFCEINGSQKVLDIITLETLVDTKNRFNVRVSGYNYDGYKFGIYTSDKHDFLNEKDKIALDLKYNDVIFYDGFLFGGFYRNEKVEYSLINPNTKFPYRNTGEINLIGPTTKDKKHIIVGKDLKDRNEYFLINREGFRESKGYNNLTVIGDHTVLMNNDEIGLINNNGREIFKRKYVYKDIEQVSDFLPIFFLKTFDHKISILNLKSKKLYKTDAYDLYMLNYNRDRLKEEIRYFFAADEKHNKGIISVKGDILIPCIYNNLLQIGDTDYFLATNSQQKTGVIDINNKTVLPFTNEYLAEKDLYYLNAPQSDENNIKSYYFIWKINDKVGVVDLNNKVMIPFEYDFIENKGDFTTFGQYDKLGIFAKSGIVIPAQYDKTYVWRQNNTYYLFKDHELIGINENNKIVYKSGIYPMHKQFSEPRLYDGRILFLEDQRISHFQFLDGKELMKIYHRDVFYNNGIGVSSDGLFFDLYKNQYEYHSDFIMNDFK